MLFATRHRPMRVPGFSRYASTLTGDAAPCTGNPEAANSAAPKMRSAPGTAGTIHVPGAKSRPADVKRVAARKIGTFAACSFATARNAALDSGGTTYAQGGFDGVDPPRSSAFVTSTR